MVQILKDGEKSTERMRTASFRYEAGEICGDTWYAWPQDYGVGQILGISMAVVYQYFENYPATNLSTFLEYDRGDELLSKPNYEDRKSVV